MLIALICIIVKGFNFGIDFTGGTILDLKFAQPVTVAQVRTGPAEQRHSAQRGYS